MLFIVGLSFIGHLYSHVPTSTKEWQSGLGELQSLYLILYKASHRLICDINNNDDTFPLIITTTFPYLSGLPKVGSECGPWPESGWPADQVTMEFAIF